MFQVLINDNLQKLEFLLQIMPRVFHTHSSILIFILDNRILIKECLFTYNTNKMKSKHKWQTTDSYNEDKKHTALCVNKAKF